MNTPQKVVVWCALGLLLLAVLFPPWLYAVRGDLRTSPSPSGETYRADLRGEAHAGFAFLLVGEGKVNVSLLAFECFFIVGVAAVMLYMFQTPRGDGSAASPRRPTA